MEGYIYSSEFFTNSAESGYGIQENKVYNIYTYFSILMHSLVLVFHPMQHQDIPTIKKTMHHLLLNKTYGVIFIAQVHWLQSSRTIV